jgi:hypothetical protein
VRHHRFGATAAPVPGGGHAAARLRGAAPVHRRLDARDALVEFGQGARSAAAECHRCSRGCGSGSGRSCMNGSGGVARPDLIDSSVWRFVGGRQVLERERDVAPQPIHLEGAWSGTRSRQTDSRASCLPWRSAPRAESRVSSRTLGSERSFFSTSQPSISGIMRSRMIRSGSTVGNLRSASRPSCAVTTS